MVKYNIEKDVTDIDIVNKGVNILQKIVNEFKQNNQNIIIDDINILRVSDVFGYVEEDFKESKLHYKVYFLSVILKQLYFCDLRENAESIIYHELYHVKNGCDVFETLGKDAFIYPDDLLTDRYFEYMGMRCFGEYYAYRMSYKPCCKIDNISFVKEIQYINKSFHEIKKNKNAIENINNVILGMIMAATKNFAYNDVSQKKEYLAFISEQNKEYNMYFTKIHLCLFNCFSKYPFSISKKNFEEIGKQIFSIYTIIEKN